MEVRRLDGNPIIHRDDDRVPYDNINGPSLVKTPAWVDDPFGAYYLYFAGHSGSTIRLAYSDDLTGPWTLHGSPPLALEDTGEAFDDHIASPDVHALDDERHFRLYYHGCCSRYKQTKDGLRPANTNPAQKLFGRGLHPGELDQKVSVKQYASLSLSQPYTIRSLINGAHFKLCVLCDELKQGEKKVNQLTNVAISEDGVEYTDTGEALGQFYFRVFRYNGYYYALAKENHGPFQRSSGQRIYRSKDGLSDFEVGPLLFHDGARHTAVRRQGDLLEVFYSRIGDAPERILISRIDLSKDWENWEATEPQTVLQPEEPWEGAYEPVEPSERGSVSEQVNQLRDPCIYEEGDQTFLLYTVGGECGIGISEIID